MNVPTIDMPQEDARAKLEQYRSAIAAGAISGVVEGEYERAVEAYAALANGTPLLVLSDVFRRAPRDSQERPRLAIARADRRQVYFSQGNYSQRASFNTWNHSRGRQPRDSIITVGLAQRQRYDRDISGYSLVPMVPPELMRGRRYGSRRDLSKHFILWEVEAWADTPRLTEPDIDPYLLQRVSGDVYAIVGEWDLTDVERMVMASRASA